MQPVRSGLAGLGPLAVGVAIGAALAFGLQRAPAHVVAPPAQRAPPPGVAAGRGLALPADELEPAGAQDRLIAQRVAQARALLVAEKHEELDRMLADLRSQRLADGTFLIGEVYRDLGEPVNTKQEGPWETHIEQLRAWAAAQPKSVAAHSALANGLSEWAWHARGTGYSDTVTAEGRRLFRERLTLAQAECEAATAADPKALDPYLVWLVIGRGLGYERPRMEELAKKGLAIEPAAYPIHRQMVVHLLPRWYGDKGDWEAYAEKAAGADDALYARIVTIAAVYETSELFKVARVSWARVVKGLQKLVRAHPTSSTMASRLAWWGWIADDRMVAKAAFARLGDRYEGSIWRTRQQFEKVRAWALQ